MIDRRNQDKIIRLLETLANRIPVEGDSPVGSFITTSLGNANLELHFHFRTKLPKEVATLLNTLNTTIADGVAPKIIMREVKHD